MRRKRTFHNGFTVIELLVVISIILILIAIVLPILKTAREEAYNAICTSQLDQIYSASFAYGVENDDRLPFFGYVNNHPYKDRWWVTQIADGMQDQFEMYRCPTDDVPGKVWVTRKSESESRKLRMASPRQEGAFNLDISYLGSCDLTENVKVTNPNGAITEVNRGRKFTAWGRPPI